MRAQEHRSGPPTVSQRGRVAPFRVMGMVARAQARQAAGLPVVNLSVGQPGMGAPTPVRRAAAAALADPLGYTPTLGLPALREAIAHEYGRRGVQVDAANVAVTTGSSGAFLLAFLTAFESGDAVAMGRPGYPAYRNLLHSLGQQVLEVPTGPDTRFQPTPEHLSALPVRPRGLVVASPANPTGTMLGAGELAGLLDWCVAADAVLVSDEIYHGLSYAEPGVCLWGPEVAERAAGAREHGIVVNSFSKYFGMTGWRLGWMLVPDRLVDAVDALAGNLALCPPAVSQYAALAAFTEESLAECEVAVEGYRRNRDLLLGRLPRLGLDRLAPADGAFYVYADVSAFTDDSLAWCEEMIEATGVVCAPGIDFDPVDGHRFVRFSFAGPYEEIARGLDWLEPWLAAQSTSGQPGSERSSSGERSTLSP
ncbi:MAG: pyridoxal phosphate-dependent aminotransferase [Propionibacteriaceae bacterium]